MSHSVKVSIALNTTREIQALDKLKNSVNNCADVFKDAMKNQTAKLNSEITKSKEYLISLQNEVVYDEELYKYKINISNIQKRIANLKSLLNYGKVYESIHNQNNDLINEIFKEYGIIAILSYEDLKEEGINITPEILKTTIENSRQKKVGQDKIKNLKTQIQMDLLKSELPEDVQRDMVNFLKGNTYQEWMDVAAFIETKINEFSASQLIVKDVIKGLKQMGFEFKNQKYIVSDDGEIITRIISHKTSTKTFTLDVNTQKQMSWQFGNYESHMCDADGEKFRNEIMPSLGFKFTGFKITRNVSNSKPLQKARVFKTKEKNEY